MIKFDENLIIYQKIFKVSDILLLYEHFKQFNYHLPDDWHQLDLFTFHADGLALLLGIDKEVCHDSLNTIITKFTYYFLVEHVDMHTKRCNKIEIFTVPALVSKIKTIDNIDYQVADKDSLTFFYTLNKVTSLKKDIIKEKDTTLNRFLKLFDIQMCQNAFMPVPYSMNPYTIKIK